MNNEIKYSFCEKNLMILPFISLKREPEKNNTKRVENDKW